MLKESYFLTGRTLFRLLLPLLRITRKRSRLRTRAFIVSDDHVLLVKDWFSKQQWSLPGGGIAKNETPQEALARELQEELGFAVLSAECVALGALEEDNLKLGVYQVRLGRQCRPRISKKEIVEAKWFPLGAVPSNSEAYVHHLIGQRLNN